MCYRMDAKDREHRDVWRKVVGIVFPRTDPPNPQIDWYDFLHREPRVGLSEFYWGQREIYFHKYMSWIRFEINWGGVG